MRRRHGSHVTAVSAEDRDDESPAGVPCRFRLYLLAMAVLALLAMLIGKLWHIQVLQGGEHTRLTLRQSIRPIRLNAVRGRILSAEGEVLVGNRCLLDAVCHLAEMRQPGASTRTVAHVLAETRRLSELIGRTMPVTDAQVARHLRVHPVLPMTVFPDLGPREVAILGELLPPVPGLEIVPRFERAYASPLSASHVLGYTGRERPEATAEMGRYPQAYVSPELHGWAGLERAYDLELAGAPGSRLVRVSALGYVYEDIGTPVPPRNGNDIVLTLDAAAQRVAEAVLAGDAEHPHSALVLLDVRSGAVLAMASKPGFDLSRVDSSGHDRSYFQALEHDRVNRPLLNRAMQATMPGSILKPLIGLAALESGAIGPLSSYHCDGAFELGPAARIRCWHRYGHGDLTFVEAVAASCNPYFIHAAVATGLDRLEPVLRAAGLGRRPALDIPPQYAPGERGICPSRAWLRQTSGGVRSWLYSDTAYLGIGQGLVEVSPLQAALFTAALANGGTLYRPFLVRSSRRPDGTDVRVALPVVDGRLPVSEEHLGLVRQGMYEAVANRNGTARTARNRAISLAGKTGTAEMGRALNRYKQTWFTGYGPVEDPRYAIAVLVERGDSGGKTAAPLAARFFEAWLGVPGEASPEAAAAVEGWEP